MDRLVFGTARFRDIEHWEEVCRKYGISYSFRTRNSRIGFEGTWYQLSVDVPDESVRAAFMHDIHNSWMPKVIQEREGNHA